MSSSCIFCRILAGEIPSAGVYEDEHTVAFMDINPVAKGHTLVIPRIHCNPIMDAPDEVLEHVIRAVKIIARAQVKGLGARAVNVTQANGELAGQVVPHVHFHVIPRFESAKDARNWIPGKYDNPGEMKAFADRIRAAI